MTFTPFFHQLYENPVHKGMLASVAFITRISRLRSPPYNDQSVCPMWKIPLLCMPVSNPNNTFGLIWGPHPLWMLVCVWALRNLATYALHNAGGVKVPSKTVGNASKTSIKGGIKKGVWQAWVKWCLISSKHTFSSSVFWWYSFHSPEFLGAIMCASGWCSVFVCNAHLTMFAVFQILSFVCSCFHSAHLGQFHVATCASLTWLSKVSQQLLSFLSCQRSLYALDMMSWIDVLDHMPGCGMWSSPAFFAWVLSIVNHTLPPCLCFSMLFQNSILFMLLVTCGHHWTWLHCNFLHVFSAWCFARVTMLSMALSLASNWHQRSLGPFRIGSSWVNLCGMFVYSFSHCINISLYHATTLGSLQVCLWKGLV